ncbi:hypothetical protein [Planktothrix agardhii]|jgi:hypothetical protein|uniref:Uncharacterized protein n=1 Tax=Planktothrix agardhii (strain NIVA-CYA 126/8) TaxID=388467 RepID=A0A073CLD6_PLAA1|nr:hypothetical protein [Planktothrix agardhii]KEI68951.1 hypothetical protein A19Y_4270 [Planktothrix agardhii NIVA-CYA 126/8]MCB8758217.1 hypothetical protein [Planktothrix agardhii 1813]BBD53827.1 hypothetical protein NIES204_11090 [Planktothrix agardhii NIES-204]CAD5909471.1 hypothetical protein NIVACYA_00084 [Planktothrix agardhii]
MQDYNELIPQLLELDEESLEAQLGLQVQGTAKGLTLDSIDLDAAARAPISPEVLAAGQQLLKRLNSGLYDLMCNPLGSDSETEKVLDEVINQNYVKAAGMLAPLLVSGLGLAPAIATLIATLVVKKIAKAGSEEICKSWKASLPTEES